MTIKKAINSTTLLIPSVLLNATLVILAANYIQTNYERAAEDCGQPNIISPLHPIGGKSVDTAPKASVDAAAVPDADEEQEVF